MQTLIPDPEVQLREAGRSEQWYLKLFRAMAHEVSQPLTTLSGEAELALATPHTQAEYRAVLENSLMELDRLSETVRRFRELAELEIPAAPGSSVSVLDPLRRALDLMAPVAESLGVKLSLDAPRECYVIASAERLERALYKLVQRALERSQRGGTVRVAASTSGNLATIKVSDGGPEVSPREASGVLDSRGNGLEWAFACRFAEFSDGTFTVENGADQGCVVCLALPLSATRKS